MVSMSGMSRPVFNECVNGATHHARETVKMERLGVFGQQDAAWVNRHGEGIAWRFD